MHIAFIPVPGDVAVMDKAGQELAVARLMYAHMRERFGKFAEWITYDTFGQDVWFHDKVISGN